MKTVETKYNLEFTKEEIELLVKALNGECKCRGERIANLKDSTAQDDCIRRCKLIEEYRPYRKLLGELGDIIGMHFMGNDY